MIHNGSTVVFLALWTICDYLGGGGDICLVIHFFNLFGSKTFTKLPEYKQQQQQPHNNTSSKLQQQQTHMVC